MNNDVFGHLAEHYASVARELSSQAQQAGLLRNPTATGTEREDVYRAFLERHLPRSCDVFLGGYLFDTGGNSSTQMDVIATSGIAPRFRMSSGNRYIAPLEGTIAVAEIKSRLTKATLHEALAGCASIPTMPESTGIVAPYLRVDEARWQDTPYKIVFAYDGIAVDTACSHIAEYYQQNGHIPLSRRPNIIHVLEKYTIIRITPDMRVMNLDGSDSTQLDVGRFHPFVVASDVSAMAWILIALQGKAFECAHLLYKFDRWHDNIIARITRASRDAR